MEFKIIYKIDCLNMQFLFTFVAKIKTMKKILFPILTLALLTSCNEAPKGEETITTEAQQPLAATGASFKVDPTISKVGFLGTKPIGTHTGEFKLTDGSLSVEDNKLKGGNFTIDVSSMTITDKDLTYSEKLKTHLLSPDFFDATRFGVAKFEITSIEALENNPSATHNVSGNLTLKDSTQNVTFPANITITENEVKANGKFNIDRTQWGLHYGNDKSLGDKFIYPEVQINLDVTAKK